MDELQRGILTLVKSAITGVKASLPEGFSMEAAEKPILSHQIVGLAYEGAVLCGVSKQEPVMQRLFENYYQQIYRNEKQTTALDQLFAAFEEHGIDYLPVKGCNLKKLYPNPAMRAMGDADVLIRLEQYTDVRSIMQDLGYTEGQQTGHELVWDSENLHLELHKQLLSSYHPDLQRYFGDGWKLARLYRGHRYTYSAEDMYIFLFAHFVKHYRRSGIGIRHVLDLWLYRLDNPQMDMDYVLKEMEKLKIWEFHSNVVRVTDYWFNGADADEVALYISDYIFESGSWGTFENGMRFLGMNQKMKSGSARRGKRKRMIRDIFPPVREMKCRYPIVGKAPWLLPIFWPIRWVSALLFRRKNIRMMKRLSEYYSESEVTAYEKALEYVGLQYEL